MTVIAHSLRSVAATPLRVASRRRTASQPLPSASESVLRLYNSSRSVALGDAAAVPASSDSAADSRAEECPFASPRVEELFHRMKNLERDDLSTISDLVYERLGIEITPEMFVGGGGEELDVGTEDGVSVEEEKVEEKTAFDLKLVSFDAKAKIKVIKEVRSMAGLGLKEAKEMVEAAPKVVMKDIKQEEAEELKAKLEEVGATVEIS